MKLGTRGRYAVMALLDLALRENEGPISLSDISERQFISLSYLEQLFNKLRRHGLVRSVRGAGGGYHLNRSPAQITIADVILAVDEPIKATRCSARTGKGCLTNGTQCITHHLWEGLNAHIITYLKDITLQQALAKNTSPLSVGATQEGAHD